MPNCLLLKFLILENIQLRITIIFLMARINYATSYIDGDSIYGKKYSDLEPFIEKNGEISLTFLFPSSNKASSLLWVKLIWIEWHNSLAKMLFQMCPKLPKQVLFNEARKFTIGTLQSVYSYDWLLQWTGKPLQHYERYDPLIDPQIEKLFQAAMYLPQALLTDHWLNGPSMLDKKSCKEYEKYANKFSIQAHWPDINHARKVLKLIPYENFESFVKQNNVTHSKQLVQYYRNKLEQFDALSGGLLESKSGSGVLFSAVLHDQFRRIRDGDRLWFENLQNVLFTSKEITRLKEIKFLDVFKAVLVDLLDRLQSFNKDSTKLQKVDFSYEKILYYIIGGYFFAILCIIIICIFIRKQKAIQEKIKENANILQHFRKKFKITSNLFLAEEYDHLNIPRQKVVLVLDNLKHRMIVYTISGLIFRVIVNDIEQIIFFGSQPIVILKSMLSYNLIVGFENLSRMNIFLEELNLFLHDVKKQKKMPLKVQKWRPLKTLLLTRKQYQILLEKLFRVTFAQAFKIKHSQQEILDVGSTLATQVEYCKLTVLEFSECLGINPEGKFARSIFSLIDRNNEGFICFRQFLDLLILFVTGKADVKASLFFKLYDIDGVDSVSKHGFKTMLSSFLSIVADVSEPTMATSMIREANFAHKDKLALRHFLKVVSNYLQTLSRANLDIDKTIPNDRSYLSIAAKTLSSLYKRDISHGNQAFEFDRNCKCFELKARNRSNKVLTFFENHSKDVFCISFPILVICLIVVHCGYAYWQKSDFQGITQIVLAISKGSSYGIVLTYAILLVTCCENILYQTEGYYRKIVSIRCLLTVRTTMVYLSALFTIIHLLGYAYVSQILLVPSSNPAYTSQSTNAWSILEFRIPNPVFLSGIGLFSIFSVSYLLLLPCLRRRLTNTFYVSSKDFLLYLPVFALFVVHCSLSEKSILLGILPGPVTLFMLNTFLGLQKPKPCYVINMKVLPCNVLCLTLKRPTNFNYKNGQWIVLSNNQGFSGNNRMFLSSSPIEPNLRIYVSPEEPYAYQLRKLCENIDTDTSEPLFINGPYGKALVQWQDFDVTILVASDKGVKMFNSILGEIAAILKRGVSKEMFCKKIYFVWTTDSQKYFEYIDDLLWKIEEMDQGGLFNTHLFITEAYEHFNLRSIMTKIFEEHFKRVSQKNIFTGLKTVTQFGRPDFHQLFLKISLKNEWAEKMCVVSSGPKSFTNSVNRCLNNLSCKINQQLYHEIMTNVL
ncbi:dual oxidase 1-like isoform X2 [Anthonomus grandis grandis]|uniref:dual oxidase 1-like isoform X2 n=1 Tax=Anthonomus grandis grandis TaxID=2921223 RepID=UPI002165776D|nr:dual oxidase 1-like isoform X2 [Anthonomus grandis grandis]